MTDDRARPLLDDDLDADPLGQLRTWLDDARRAGVPQPEAMALATAARDGRPSARMVLLKGLDDRGVAFYTSYESRKARDLDENPVAALVLYWDALGRQVRIEGRVERVAREESEAYFVTRPRGSRLATWASAQSRPLRDRAELDERWRELEERYPADVPLPPHWGGYRVLPDAIEFWQHREHRLHDRFRYTRAREGWSIERLAP